MAEVLEVWRDAGPWTKSGIYLFLFCILFLGDITYSCDINSICSLKTLQPISFSEATELHCCIQ